MEPPVRGGFELKRGYREGIELLLQQDQRQVISQRIDPKLIMANTILQQTTLELAQHIEAELLENPALDVMEEDSPCGGQCLDAASCPYCSQRISNTYRADTSIDVEPEVFSDGAYEIEPDDDFDPVGNLEAELTIQDHLRGLLRAAVVGPDFVIAEYIINC